MLLQVRCLPFYFAGVLFVGAFVIAGSAKQNHRSPVFTHKSDHSVEHVAFSKSQELCLIVTPDSIDVLGSEDGKVISRIQLKDYDFFKNSFKWAEFASDQQIFATTSGSKSVQVYDIKTGVLAKTIGEFEKQPTRVHPTELANKLLVRTYDDFWQLYDVRKKQNDWKADFASGFMSYCFCYRHPTLAVVQDDDAVVFVEAENGKPLRHKVEHNEKVRGINISHDQKTAVTADESGTVKVYDFATKKTTWSPFVDKDGAFGVAIHPDNDHVAIGCMRGVKILSLKEKIIAGWNGHGWFVDSLQFSADGRFLLSGSADKTTKLWKTIEILKGNSYETSQFNLN